MTENDVIGMALAALVLFGMVRLLGPRPGFRIRIERRRKAKVRRRKVPVHPLVLKERRLAKELRKVRAQLRAGEIDA
ncbi:hypothetical protein [Alicyclobacillus macrosporangiidus]|uniref:hypothetical protein n=1 Tax=Alicyclobacillus macrosporangiidus TaxID=392015 RepID=UPI000495175C|nr:hypothetical protein [Alicyclobacillus macrosporangiidus]MCL6598594.1 hypothetical protein [Alicyclobacillus macrosporangiidus]